MITFRILCASNVVLPGDHFLPCLQTITGSLFSAKHGRLKRILPVCVVLPVIRMRFSGLALAWLHKAASTFNSHNGKAVVRNLCFFMDFDLVCGDEEE